MEGVAAPVDGRCTVTSAMAPGPSSTVEPQALPCTRPLVQLCQGSSSSHRVRGHDAHGQVRAPQLGVEIQLCICPRLGIAAARAGALVRVAPLRQRLHLIDAGRCVELQREGADEVQRHGVCLRTKKSPTISGWTEGGTSRRAAKGAAASCGAVGGSAFCKRPARASVLPRCAQLLKTAASSINESL